MTTLSKKHKKTNKYNSKSIYKKIFNKSSKNGMKTKKMRVGGGGDSRWNPNKEPTSMVERFTRLHAKTSGIYQNNFPKTNIPPLPDSHYKGFLGLQTKINSERQQHPGTNHRPTFPDYKPYKIIPKKSFYKIHP